MDLTRQEFKATYLTLKIDNSKLQAAPVTILADDSAEDIEIDWVAKGAVTPVKD